MVVKYADNIQKNFANALSVALTVLGAAPLFGLWPSPWFLVGVAATLLSVSMYSGTAPPPPRPLQEAWDYFDRRLCPAWLKRACRDVVLALGLDRGGLHGLVRRTSSSAATSAAFLAAVAAANGGSGEGHNTGGGSAGDLGGKRSSLSALESGNGVGIGGGGGGGIGGGGIGGGGIGGGGGGGGSDDGGTTREHGVSDSARRRARVRVSLYSVVLLLLSTLVLELRSGSGRSGAAAAALGRRGGGGAGVESDRKVASASSRVVGVGIDAERHPARLHHKGSGSIEASMFERVVPGDADGSDRGHQRAKKEQKQQKQKQRGGDEIGGKLLLRRQRRRRLSGSSSSSASPATRGATAAATPSDPTKRVSIKKAL